MDAAIQTALKADPTLVGLLPGGIYSTADADEVSRQETASAYDSNGEMRPCCYVSSQSAVRDGPHDNGAVEYLVIYFYQQRGYAAVKAANARVFTLLNRVRFSGKRAFELIHTDDGPPIKDQSLGVSLLMSRYMAVKLRV